MVHNFIKWYGILYKWEYVTLVIVAEPLGGTKKTAKYTNW